MLYAISTINSTTPSNQSNAIKNNHIFITNVIKSPPKNSRNKNTPITTVITITQTFYPLINSRPHLRQNKDNNNFYYKQAIYNKNFMKTKIDKISRAMLKMILKENKSNPHEDEKYKEVKSQLEIGFGSDGSLPPSYEIMDIMNQYDVDEQYISNVIEQIQSEIETNKRETLRSEMEYVIQTLGDNNTEVNWKNAREVIISDFYDLTYDYTWDEINKEFLKQTTDPNQLKFNF